jgi:hypothetical protein
VAGSFEIRFWSAKAVHMYAHIDPK